MFKVKKNILYVTLGIIALVLLVNVSLGTYLSSRNVANSQADSSQVVAKEAESSKSTFSYEGVEGKSALAILESKTEVEKGSSGLVVSIGGRKADDSKKEFWAFYVNGKMAEVGPADYIAKEGDRIEWKIEKY